MFFFLLFWCYVNVYIVSYLFSNYNLKYKGSLNALYIQRYWESFAIQLFLLILLKKYCHNKHYPKSNLKQHLKHLVGDYYSTLIVLCPQKVFIIEKPTHFHLIFI